MIVVKLKTLLCKQILYIPTSMNKDFTITNGYTYLYGDGILSINTKLFSFTMLKS